MIELSIKSCQNECSAGQVSVKYWVSGSELSEGVGRELANMSTESQPKCRPTCRSIYRPRVSTDRGYT